MFFKTTTLLSLLAALATTTTAISIPRGDSDSAISPCPPNQIHLHGACIPYVPCGGIANVPCQAKSQVCVDDPRDDCVPGKGGADCAGICVEPKKQCGGWLGLMCPSGYECVDDPRDECVPEKWVPGGEICLGVCV